MRYIIFFLLIVFLSSCDDDRRYYHRNGYNTNRNVRNTTYHDRYRTHYQNNNYSDNNDIKKIIKKENANYLTPKKNNKNQASDISFENIKKKKQR